MHRGTQRPWCVESRYEYYDIGTVVWTPLEVALRIYQPRTVIRARGPDMIACRVLLVGAALFNVMRSSQNWPSYIRMVDRQQVQLLGMDLIASASIPGYGFTALGPEYGFGLRVALCGEAEVPKTFEQWQSEREYQQAIEDKGDTP